MFSHIIVGVSDLEASPKLYLAYLRDPDGNKLCALHHPPKV
jgi:hypothetical protein